MNNDISNTRFGFLTAIRQSGSDDGAVWECVCDCGDRLDRKAGSLRRSVRLGRTPSCGCGIEQPSRVVDGRKECLRCHAVKPVAEFARATDKPCGYQTYCRSCTKRWRQANQTYLKRTKKEYAVRNRKRILQRMKEYNRANSAAITAKTRAWAKRNPEKRKQIANAWVKRNPAYNCHRVGLRRAAMLRATPAWADLDAIKAIYREANGLGMTVDHIVPLVSKYVCGLHCEENLQILKFEENLRKGNRYWPDMP